MNLTLNDAQRLADDEQTHASIPEFRSALRVVFAELHRVANADAPATQAPAGSPLAIDSQIKCVRREIAMRERVYPSWVSRGKMKQAEADYQIQAMRSVLKTLTDIRDAQVALQP